MDQLNFTEVTEASDTEAINETEAISEVPAPQEHQPAPVPRGKSKKPFLRRYAVGMLTAPLTLITLGVTLLITLISGGSPMNVVKVLPLALVYLGLEILFNLFVRRSGKILLEQNSMIFTAGIAFVVLCLSIPFMTGTAGDNAAQLDARATVEQSISAQACEKFKTAVSASDYSHYIRSVEAEAAVKGLNTDLYKSIDNLQSGDQINVTIILRETPAKTEEFVEICRGIIPSVREAGVPVNKLMFICDDPVAGMSLTLDGTFELDLSAEEMEKLASYVSTSYYEQADVEDLE